MKLAQQRVGNAQPHTRRGQGAVGAQLMRPQHGATVRQEMLSPGGDFIEHQHGLCLGVVVGGSRFQCIAQCAR